MGLRELVDVVGRSSGAGETTGQLITPSLFPGPHMQTGTALTEQSE